MNSSSAYTDVRLTITFKGSNYQLSFCIFVVTKLRICMRFHMFIYIPKAMKPT